MTECTAIDIDNCATHGWGGTSMQTTGRHADKAELLTEELNTLKAAIAETEIQISWHATRYAMDGDRTNHDAMIEALTIIRSVIWGNNEPMECRCNWPEKYPHAAHGPERTCAIPGCGATNNV